MRFLALILAVCALAPLAAAKDERPNRRSCAQATRPIAQALAERAAQHLARVGPQQAFSDFQDPAGGFLDGDLYVFVFDFEGTLKASGGFPGESRASRARAGLSIGGATLARAAARPRSAT